MRCLVIDRSSSCPGMAVFEERELLCERDWEGEPARAPTWIAEMAQTLEMHEGAVAGIGQFVCGLGPGSFSGIRASLSVAQGMALPGRCAVYGVASAAALALGQAYDGVGCVTVVGDARRNRLWSVTYRVDPATHGVRLYNGCVPTHTEADFLLTPHDELAATVPRDTRIVTADWDRLGDLLSGLFAAERLVTRAVFPKAADVGRLALAELEACVLEPLPVYLHPAVATRGPASANA